MRIAFTPRSTWLPVVAGIAAVLAAPTGAAAAGFAQPVSASGRDDAYDPQVAIAPNGRTAVLSKREVRRGRGWLTQYRAAIGPSPSELGPAKTVGAGWRAAASDATAPMAELLARPDGGFVACFSDYSRHQVAVEGCSIAQPTGEFGALDIVRRIPQYGDHGMAATVLSDSSVVLLLTRTLSGADGPVVKTASSFITLGAGGDLRREHPINRTQLEQSYNTATPIVATANGTIAIPAVAPLPGGRSGVRAAVRVKPPGADAFGRAIPVSDEPLKGSIWLGGRADLLVSFPTSPAEGGPSAQRVVSLAPDGSPGPALTLPGSQPADYLGAPVSPVLELPGGELFAITGHVETDPEDSDCYNPVVGTVAAGLFTQPGQPAATPAPLSTKGQIALGPQGAVLDDGTVIAAWVNGANGYGQTRVEARIRAPGASAFGPSQPLAPLSKGEYFTLATGGDHAALAWEIGGYGDPSRIVISDLRQVPPYAEGARLPRHPATNCDE